MHLILSSIWLAFVIWLIARAFSQRDLLPKLERTEAPDAAPKVAVIIPARDEAANIGRCLSSLIKQTYPASRLRIVLVDDHSNDATMAIATALAQTCSQLTLLRSPALPPHWVGKSHACWIGARAVAQEVDWLCFVDADVWAEPALVASAMAAVRDDGLDLLSLAPRQELGSFAERLVMPCGLYLLAFFQGRSCPLSANTGSPAFHSINSSARESTLAGILRPSFFAVVRLIVKSNLVGCSTGRSAGEAPRRILSTYVAACRYRSSTFGP